MIKFNCTLELKDEKEVSNFIHYIQQYTKVIDYSILPSTEYLYDNDDNFRKLVKEYKKARDNKNKYIQENN